VAGVGVVHGGPVVDAPVDHGWREQRDSQRLVPGDAAGLVIKAPPEDLSDVLFLQVTPDRLWRLIENLAVANGAAQLDVLRMRPPQRTGRSRGFAAEQFEFRNIGGIPDLFREQATVA